MRFKDQDGRLLEIKGKGNFTLLINRQKLRYSIEPKAKKKSKDMDFYHSCEIYLTNMENNYWILLPKQDQML